MTISSKPIGIFNAENAYQQSANKIKGKETNDQVQKQVTAADKNQVLKPKITTGEVLSSMEQETLRVLFGSENPIDQKMYGRSKVNNIQSGYLLDIKG